MPVSAKFKSTVDPGVNREVAVCVTRIISNPTNRYTRQFRLQEATEGFQKVSNDTLVNYMLLISPKSELGN
jgi:hypothetical protein